MNNGIKDSNFKKSNEKNNLKNIVPQLDCINKYKEIKNAYKSNKFNIFHKYIF